ncbi:hypothetical protein A1O7_05724 [Cladophialophora yegresii CBS 114405]|uniref:Cytochrome P450 oxidoreductase n=1 Tax=Cladophialophora yegresii CBS 114405 TaxID=1182544 RepID=W9WIH3_9EURO|nr:uncharacterized protein A1O7_05724 [Cladophialophora yegresii CBS 114405]EXJ58299.1 hypothetical protein A1O7_05724 [Cladophialophora yegresii CBS 114405]
MISSSSFWLWSLAIGVLAAVYFRYRRLSPVPGPFLAALTDLWRFSLTRSGHFSDTLVDLHTRYGAFVRIGPNAVSISDPAAVPTVHSMHGEFRKADSYSTLRALFNGKVIGTVVDLQDENEVSALKRAVGSAFATRNLLDYEPDVDHTLDRLVQAIRKRRTFSLLDAMQQFQVDFLMKAAFSRDTDYLETNRSTYEISGDARVKHWYTWQSMPGLEWLLFKSPLSPAWHRSPPKPPAWTAMASAEYDKRVKLHSDKPGGRESRKPDLLSKYLSGAEQHKDSVSQTTIVRVISSTIAAGFDTSAYTITMTLYYLLKHPAVLKKLRSELDDALDSGRLSRRPRFNEVDKLDYLEAIFKETMRLQPFLKPLLEREVPAGGADIAGRSFPGGTTVAISVLNVHRDTAVFGKDADEFRPERWLEADHQHRASMERSMLAFGGGKRVCMGRHIAALEMRKAIPRLLMEFDVSFTRSANRVTANPASQPDLIGRSKLCL